MNVEALEPRSRPDSLYVPFPFSTSSHSCNSSCPFGRSNRLSTATARLKSKMEQAIFFGRSDNPLSFELEEDVRGQGDVAEAAELVSGEVVAARASHILPPLPLLSHLMKPHYLQHSRRHTIYFNYL